MSLLFKQFQKKAHRPFVYTEKPVHEFQPCEFVVTLLRVLQLKLDLCGSNCQPVIWHQLFSSDLIISSYVRMAIPLSEIYNVFFL